MREEIQKVLGKVAQTFKVDILFAVESGSRMWGFESPDSDYDVRFVYSHPRTAYCGLYEPLQVIDRNSFNGSALLWTDPLDFAGWDIRKALKLVVSGNATLGEWVRSPIVYADSPIRGTFLELMQKEFQQQKYFMHYRGMAHSDTLDPAKITVKKALYALRCLLCAHHIFHHGNMPAICLAELVEAYEQRSSEEPIRERIRIAFDGLLALKRSSPEQTIVRPGQVQLLWVIKDLDKWCTDVANQLQPLEQSSLDKLTEQCSGLMVRHLA